MLYRGTNKNRESFWLIADNEEEARIIALDNRLVKDKVNLKLELSDNRLGNFYDFFKNKGNDMTEVDTKKGVGVVAYKGGNDKGTWVVI